MALHRNPASLARRGVLARRWHVNVDVIRAVVNAAARAGVPLNDWQAERIIDEIMDYHQGEYSLVDNISPELWDSEPGIQERIRMNMKRILAVQLMEQNLIPCSAIHETIERDGDPARFPIHAQVRIIMRIRVRPAPAFQFKVKRYGEIRHVS